MACKDTLVCQNLEIATKIGYGQRRYRVVTLDGKMIEMSGTMSGGGKPRRGGMSFKIQLDEVPKEEIMKLKGDVERFQKKLQKVMQEKVEV